MTLLNGEIDKVTHSADRSLYFYIFADGRYGTFSTNRLDQGELENFIGKAIEMVRMLGEDSLRRLPDPDRTEKGALTGLELGLYDSAYQKQDTDSRIAAAVSMSMFKTASGQSSDYRLISEECEYTDSYDDTFLIDSQGFEGRHAETTFSAFCEMTIEDSEGNKYSGFWWENTPFESRLNAGQIARNALENAVRQIGPKPRKGGKYSMVVDRTCASRLVSPLISALNASSLQQKMSFLEGSLGKKVFSDGFTLMDMARTQGKAGSRLYDTEGVATGHRKRYCTPIFCEHIYGRKNGDKPHRRRYIPAMPASIYERRGFGMWRKRSIFERYFEALRQRDICHRLQWWQLQSCHGRLFLRSGRVCVQPRKSDAPREGNADNGQHEGALERSAGRRN